MRPTILIAPLAASLIVLGSVAAGAFAPDGSTQLSDAAVAGCMGEPSAPSASSWASGRTSEGHEARVFRNVVGEVVRSGYDGSCLVRSAELPALDVVAPFLRRLARGGFHVVAGGPADFSADVRAGSISVVDSYVVSDSGRSWKVTTTSLSDDAGRSSSMVSVFPADVAAGGD